MKRLAHLLLPLVGVCLALLVWWAASLNISDLPSPWRTWEESKIYILEPFEKRGETDQGIALLKTGARHLWPPQAKIGTGVSGGGIVDNKQQLFEVWA